MPEPLTPERLAEIRDLSVDSCSADAPYNPDVWALEHARTDLLAEVDRLTGGNAALREKAETRLRELATAEAAYRKVGNRAGAARQDYAAAEIRSLLGIEWKPGGDA
ncbi:hypothetical protein ABZW49_10725 [Nonomuraea wenchangensis]